MEEEWSKALAQLERVWPRVAGGAEKSETPPARSDPLSAEREAAHALLAAAECAGKDAPALRKLAAECSSAARLLAAEIFLDGGSIPQASSAFRAEVGFLPRLRAAYQALRRAGSSYAAVPGTPLRTRLAAKKQVQCERVLAILAGRMP